MTQLRNDAGTLGAGGIGTWLEYAGPGLHADVSGPFNNKAAQGSNKAMGTMNVAITGASGFIGGALLERLLMHGAGGAPIGRLLALTSSQIGRRRLESCHPGIALSNLDDPGLGEQLVGVDVLVHAGWSTVPATAQQDPMKDLYDNIEGGLRLLQVAIKAGVGRFVFLSSGGTVYGDSRHEVKEDHPTVPVQCYGISKLMFEHYLKVYAEQAGMEHLSLRPANVYGDVKSPAKPQGVIEHWLGAIRQHLPVEVWGRMDVVRDYLYIDDLVDVLVASLCKPLSHGVMNVGTGRGVDLSDLSNLMAKITGREISMDLVTSSGNTLVPYNVLNSERVQHCLGPFEWIPLPEGLARLWSALSSR